MYEMESESNDLMRRVEAVRMERDSDSRSIMRERCLDALRRTIPDFSDPSFDAVLADFNAKNPGLLRGLEFSLVRADGDRLLIIDASGLLDVGVVTPGKAKDMLRKVKAQERDIEGVPNSYALRRALLHRSNGQIRSFEAYTIDIGYPAGNELRTYLDDGEHWLPERRRLHERIIADEVAASMDMSEALEKKYGRKGIVVAMRGNTASGKSSIVKRMGLPERGIIATDVYKYRLRSDEAESDGWQNVANFQIHEEGALLSRKIRREVERVDGVSVVLDSRMQDRSDIETILMHAERNKRAVHFVDVDAPLVVSLIRVLGRPAGGVNPLVVHDGIVEGFEGARYNRTHLIRRVLRDPRVESYELYGMGEDGQLELVAKKQSGAPSGLEVHNREMFPTMVLPSRASAEREEAAREMIDDSFADRWVPRFRLQDRAFFRRVLEKWKDRGAGEMTLAEALDIHKGALNEIPPRIDYYLIASEKNLLRMSRTARGIVDTSATPDKAAKMRDDLTSETAASRAMDNFREALRQLFEYRETRFEDASSVRTFVESVVRIVNRGITAETAPFLRSEDSPKHPEYTSVANLPFAFEQFIQELSVRLNDSTQDPVELAAWIEYRVNMSDHFLTDGCGKVSLALSAWALMRAGRRVPAYPARDEYYRHAPKRSRDLSVRAEDDMEFAAYRAYFETLVPPTR